MAIPNDLRQMNRRDILLTLLRSEKSTRSELARATGLSQPTAGKIVEDFLADGVLSAVAEPESGSRRGRPGFGLILDETRPRFLAIQLGVVRTRVGRLTVAPPATDQWTNTFKTPTSLKAWLLKLKASTEAMFETPPQAILISVPGVLDEASGLSILSPNLRWLEGEHIATAVQEAIGIPAYAIQEIRCLALGHRITEPSAENFLLVDFGTGVGSAAVLGGESLKGARPLSGELGHTPVPGNTRPCGCGGIGCLETIIGREPLMRSLGVPPDEWYSGWTRMLQDQKGVRLPRPFREAMEAVSLNIAGALNVLGLDRVVVTGFMSDLPQPTMLLLREAVQRATLAGRFGAVSVTPAPRRRMAGLVSLAIERVLAPV